MFITSARGESFGIKSFDNRAFFAKRETTGQSLWMDLALARRSGQELRSSYTITGSPDFAPLRRFFKAAVDQLQLLYDDMPVRDFETSMALERSLINCMRDDICNNRQYPTVDGSFSHTSDIPHAENSCEINPSHMVFMICNFAHYI